MNYGIELSTPDSLENLSDKYNKFYTIGGIAGAVFGLLGIGNLGGILVGGAFGLLLGWVIKYYTIDAANHKFRTTEFHLPDNLSIEAIYSETSKILRGQEVYVTLEKNVLIFQHGSIQYKYVEKREKKTFCLYWYFSVARALLNLKITNYKQLRKDIGLIAYTIQHIESRE